MNETASESVVDRRTVLQSVGGVAAAGLLAGCGGGGDGGSGGGGDGGGGDTTEGGDGGSGDGGSGDVQSQVDSYLSEANNYDGSIVDATGQSEVTVDVGAGDGLAFGPAAVRVDAGTTVVWEWTGQGGSHNVVADDGAFESGSAVIEPEAPFEYTFESTGVHEYYCSPHELSGMKAVVVVE